MTRRRWQRFVTIVAALGLLWTLGPMPASHARAATVTVTTRAELLQALVGASAGDTVFIPGEVQIDLTNEKSIEIPPGVTLASDRGESGSPGALLFSEDLEADTSVWSQFVVNGAGVRFTGLRLQGPDQEIRDDAYAFPNARGIAATGASDLLVDNSELFAWSHAAVYLADTIEGVVRGNDIHHNRRTGLGYGVVLVGSSSAVVEDNIFTQNRHPIAGSGNRTQRYEARFNLVVDYGRSHGFDMHGEDEGAGSNNPWAGDVLHIKHNTFLSTGQYAVAVRGRPMTGAVISDNCFAHADAASAVRQTREPGNFTVGDNTYGVANGTCHQQGRRVGWRLSTSGTAAWQPMAPYTLDVSEVGFGDFDGDGRTDVFRATGAQWYYSPGGTDPWVRLATSTLRLGDVRLGDFNGDGVTDVLSVQAGHWAMSPGGTGAWVELAAATVPLDELGLGDFDGDGSADLFSTTGTQWRYLSGGSGPWITVATSTRTVDSLRFGDFNGDGRTDVFAVMAGQWQYSSGGSGAWTSLASSNLPLRQLRFGDFDGDGITDVFSVGGGGVWHYSAGGATGWLDLNGGTSCPISALHTASDFNGDGRSDVFDGRCGD